MSVITVGWADPQQHIILVTYHDVGWTWADFSEAIKQQNSLIDSVTHIVDIVVDVQNSNWMPREGSLLGIMENLSTSRHPRQRYTVIVGARGFLASVVNGLMKLRKAELRDFHFAPTLDGAYTLIKQLESGENPE
jgi:hypothetical protein